MMELSHHEISEQDKMILEEVYNQTKKYRNKIEN